MYRTLPYRGSTEVPSPGLQALAILAVATLVMLAVSKLGLLLTCVAVVGIAFLTVAALSPDWAVVVVLFILYSNVTVVAHRYYAVPEQLAAGVFLLLGFPFVFHVVLRRGGVVIDRIFLLMCAYFAVMVVSALVSGNPADSYE